MVLAYGPEKKSFKKLSLKNNKQSVATTEFENAVASQKLENLILESWKAILLFRRWVTTGK
jgi:hypothetical protein